VGFGEHFLSASRNWSESPLTQCFQRIRDLTHPAISLHNPAIPEKVVTIWTRCALVCVAKVPLRVVRVKDSHHVQGFSIRPRHRDIWLLLKDQEPFGSSFSSYHERLHYPDDLQQDSEHSQDLVPFVSWYLCST
jgi:hypothetical protein